MSIKVSATEKKILDNIKIPVRPKALLTVSEEVEKAEPSFPVIAKTISEDVSISSAMLKVVNSAAFRRASAISSIDQALNMLGLKRVLAVVNAVAVQNAVKADVDLEPFWNYASCVAQASVLICKELKRAHFGDDAYTLGLFHTTGVPIMMNTFPGYSDFYKNGEEEGWIMAIDQEKNRFNTTHTTIGALMALQWRLPSSLVNAIYYQHYVDGVFDDASMSQTTQSLLGILKMARSISHKFLNTGVGEEEWHHVENQVFKFFKIDEDTWLSIRGNVMAVLSEMG